MNFFFFFSFAVSSTYGTEHVSIRIHHDMKGALLEAIPQPDHPLYPAHYECHEVGWRSA